MPEVDKVSRVYPKANLSVFEQDLLAGLSHYAIADLLKLADYFGSDNIYFKCLQSFAERLEGLRPSELRVILGMISMLYLRHVF